MWVGVALIRSGLVAVAVSVSAPPRELAPITSAVVIARARIDFDRFRSLMGGLVTR